MLQKLTEEVHLRTRIDLLLPWIGAIGLAIVVGIAYFFAAKLSLALLAEPDGVAPFWPAAGVSSGVLIALGRGARLPVAGGVIVATILANLMGDRSMWSAAASALWNTGEALLAAWEHADHLCIKLPALREVARGEDGVTSPSEAEWGIEIGLWHVHEPTPQSFCR